MNYEIAEHGIVDNEDMKNNRKLNDLKKQNSNNRKNRKGLVAIIYITTRLLIWGTHKPC